MITRHHAAPPMSRRPPHGVTPNEVMPNEVMPGGVGASGGVSAPGGVSASPACPLREYRDVRGETHQETAGR